MTSVSVVYGLSEQGRRYAILKSLHAEAKQVVEVSDVLAISTNFGTVSEDILNRSLPIHLHPVGDVAERHSPIGNPRYEFLPANKERITAELRGMIERWKEAGQPLDDDVQHPFSLWARTIGGILKVNGFTDFLANYGMRRTADDPIRESLGLLGVARPNEWLRPRDWAKTVADLGLTRALIPERDRENEVSRARAIGIILSAHEQRRRSWSRMTLACTPCGWKNPGIGQLARQRSNTASSADQKICQRLRRNTSHHRTLYERPTVWWHATKRTGGKLSTNRQGSLRTSRYPRYSRKYEHKNCHR